MLRAFGLLCLLGLCGVLFAGAAQAATISAAEAASHIGQTFTVEGQVGEVHTTTSGITFLDLGGRYPHQLFTAVIFPENAAAFGAVDGLVGSTVDVTGPIQLYRGKPEIILRSKDQLKRP